MDRPVRCVVKAARFSLEAIATPSLARPALSPSAPLGAGSVEGLGTARNDMMGARPQGEACRERSNGQDSPPRCTVIARLPEGTEGSRGNRIKLEIQGGQGTTSSTSPRTSPNDLLVVKRARQPN